VKKLPIAQVMAGTGAYVAGGTLLVLTIVLIVALAAL
jgi:hypothetical protein